MTDRELLELAAKAIGMDVDFFGDENGFDCVTDEQEYWNPLTDDGDALRLAVKLGMMIDAEGEYRGYIQAQARDGTFAHYERNYTDPYDATRRAIVRAAAEMGKEK